MLKIVILSIGNELLMGKTVNTNVCFIGEKLTEFGYSVVANLVCRDKKEDILKILDYSYSLASVVVCTGGLGPTDDDITRGAISEYFGRKLLFDDKIWLQISDMYMKFTGQIPPKNNKAQALVPESFQVFPNEVGTAPALYKVDDEKKIFILPGVPSEMKYFMDTLVLPKIKLISPPQKFYLNSVRMFGLPEALIAEKMEEIIIKEGVNLAYLPQGGSIILRVYGENFADCAELLRTIEDKFSANIVARGEQDLFSSLHSKLIDSKLTFAMAESCTGGLFSSSVVNIPGSSAYFVGGVVSYSNEIKKNILCVDEELLQAKGAVSQEVAEAMACGVAVKFGTRLAGAITGIAGPDGGSAEKPVGLVWFAIYYDEEVFSFSRVFRGDRNTVRMFASNFFAGKLLIFLKGKEVL